MTQSAEQRAEPTPGPWRYSEVIGGCFVYGSDGRQILSYKSSPSLENRANAKLIAAAPDTAAERDRLKAANVELVKALAWYRIDDERAVEGGVLESVFDRPATAALKAHGPAEESTS